MFLVGATMWRCVIVSWWYNGNSKIFWWAGLNKVCAQVSVTFCCTAACVCCGWDAFCCAAACCCFCRNKWWTCWTGNWVTTDPDNTHTAETIVGILFKIKHKFHSPASHKNLRTFLVLLIQNKQKVCVFRLEVGTLFGGLCYGHAEPSDSHWEGGDSGGWYYSWYRHHRRRFGQSHLCRLTCLCRDGSWSRDSRLIHETHSETLALKDFYMEFVHKLVKQLIRANILSHHIYFHTDLHTKYCLCVPVYCMLETFAQYCI